MQKVTRWRDYFFVDLMNFIICSAIVWTKMSPSPSLTTTKKKKKYEVKRLQQQINRNCVHFFLSLVAQKSISLLFFSPRPQFLFFSHISAPDAGWKKKGGGGEAKIPPNLPLTGAEERKGEKEKERVGGRVPKTTFGFFFLLPPPPPSPSLLSSWSNDAVCANVLVVAFV